LPAKLAVHQIASKPGFRRMQPDEDKGRTGTTSGDRERLKSLEKENKELRRTNEILKTASAFFAQAEIDRRVK
jgi:transposase-like protein